MAHRWNTRWDASLPTGGSTPGAPNSTANAARIESLRPRPAISVSPTNHNFGTVLVKSDSTPLTVIVQNTGCLDLVVGQVTLGGTHPDQFRLKNDQVSNSTIPPDRSATLQVVFHPTSVGAKSAVLTIPSNDPGYPTVTVTISGIGKAPPLSASVGGPYAGVVNVPVTLTVSASGGVPPCTFAWALNNDGLFDDAFGEIVEWTWTLPGTYVIHLEVTDSQGWEATDTAQVQIYAGRGDVNGDGVVNLVDVQLAYLAALGLIQLTPEEFAWADMNGDGKVDM